MHTLSDVPLLLLQDVARELDVSGDAVRYYVENGRLAAMRTRNGTRVFLEEEVQRFKMVRAEAQQKVAKR